MEPMSLEQKMAQFHEFFSIKHPLTVNMLPLGKDFVVPSQQELLENMPYAFKIAAQTTNLDPQALRSLRNLGEHAKELVDFLNQQNRKIDLMMSLILQQQDDDTYRHRSIKFGGGGLVLQCEHPMELAEFVELKIFLSEEAAGVFCYAEVIACEQNGEHYEVSLLFSRIRSEDQELLVRASLHVQTLQLRARSNQQNDEH